MKRFFFGLQGRQNTDDKHGLLYDDDLQAFWAAERLAAQLSHARPVLQGNTCVVVAPRDVEDLYWCGRIVSPSREACYARSTLAALIFPDFGSVPVS